MSENQQLATNENRDLTTIAKEMRAGFDLFDVDKMDALMKVATTFSKSQLIPKRFQGKPEDCFIGLQMAARMGADPCMVLQNLYVVYGTPGFSAKFQIAMANRSGVFAGPIEFEPSGKGESLSVTAFATLLATGQRVESTCDYAMAEAEGWTENQKYTSMPVQMLSYRSACFLIRLYCPESCMGLPSREELELDGVRNVTPRERPKSDKPTLPPAAKSEPEPEKTPWLTKQKRVSEEILEALYDSLDSAEIQSEHFLAWVNSVGKDVPEGGYKLLSDLPEDRVKAALGDWEATAAKAKKWLSKTDLFK